MLLEILIDKAALKNLLPALYCIADNYCSVMPKEPINPDTLFPSVPHGFSQVIATRGGKTIYISGQTAWDAEKRLVGGNSLVEQATQAFQNVRMRWRLREGVWRTLSPCGFIW